MNHNYIALNEEDIIKAITKQKLQLASSFAKITQQAVSTQC